MVRVDLLQKKIARAAGWLGDAEPALQAPREAFVAAVKDRDLALFYLFLAIQECIDIASHWVADAGWPPPDDAAGAFALLAERQIIDATTADAMRGAVGLRNRIAHGYAQVDYARVHAEAAIDLPAIRTFLAAVGKAA